MAASRRPADNPFRAERIEALAFRFGDGGHGGEDGHDALLARWEALGRRGLLLGPCGTGKTTLLEELSAELERRGMRARRLTLSADAPRPEPEAWARLTRDLGPADLLCVDGSDLLPLTFRLRLRPCLKRAGGVLATAHRPGLLPVLRRHRVDAELAEELVARLAGAPAARALRPELGPLLAAADGDLRRVLRALYDRWGAAEAPFTGREAGESALSTLPCRPACG